MSALVITSTGVLPTATTVDVVFGVAGQAITAGMPVYLNSTDGFYYKAQADTAAEATVVGVAMNDALAAGQPVKVSRGKITIGATVEVGQVYCLGTTAGEIVPFEDLVDTNRLTIIGWGDTASVLMVQPMTTGILRTIPE